jgi:dTDP-4-dehydrorhamnose 3,5-epimerase
LVLNRKQLGGGTMSVPRFVSGGLPGLYVMTTEAVSDDRGAFRKIFDATALPADLPALSFVQTNLSTTLGRGTLRGLHFQHAPAAEYKLVRCLRGRVHDVVVDLRQASPTFLKSVSFLLAAATEEQLLIPPGCAHGFQCLEDRADLLYHHTAPWSREHEDGVRFDDPALGIQWPLPVERVSQRDLSFASALASARPLPA